jgi:hypothetical protein
MISYKPYFHPIIICFSIFDLYQNDEILGNLNLETFSVNPALQKNEGNPNSEYELYSD